MTVDPLPPPGPEADRFRRAEAIFHAALARPEGERFALLDAACPGDPDLKAEVLSLLAADGAAGDFLEAAILGGAIAFVPPSRRRIGPYLVERELGRGGMGAVYLAARADDPDRRRVAVKLLAGCGPGLAGAGLLARFANERRILARLDHPNIARLEDAGATADGIPYVVMEAVFGEPIDAWCDRRRMSIPERLELFRTVCAAVSAAHASLVVHRDLKPGNILVTEEGAPKLLDFGIAKLLEGDAAEDPTRTASRLLTPAYASPEQLRGEPVTTASDVYSLGVLLHELLTGQRPDRAAAEPERPSAVVARLAPAMAAAVAAARQCSPGELARRLSGDLDNIVQKALRAAPERRYGSVEQLAEDLRRHLVSLPVAARPDTLAYRTGKFLRRHRAAVAAGLAFATLALVLGGAVAIQAARAARERDKAEETLAFLVDLFAVSDPGEARGRDLSARELLDRGAARVDRELRGQPVVRAALLDALGRVYLRLGLYERAGPLLATALALRQQALGAEHPDVAESWTRLGDLWQAQDEYDRAEAAYRKALALREQLFGAEHPAVAASLDSLADVLSDRGDYRAALPLLRRALALREKRFGPESLEVAASRNSLGLLLHERGQTAAALPLYREALAVRRRLLGPDHPDVAMTLNNLAALLQARGELAAAEPLLRQALAINRKALGDRHATVGINLQNLAMLRNARGAPHEAEALLKEALEIHRQAVGGESSDVATVLHDLGLVQARAGETAAAEGSFRAALQLYREKLSPGHPYVAHPLVELGRLLLARGEAAAAEPLLAEALAIRRRGLPAPSARTAEAAGLLGACLAAQGRRAEALPLLEESYRVFRAALGEGHASTHEARERLARLGG
jgi:eukaryotic-like serine/threonine-protein kinase